MKVKTIKRFHDLKEKKTRELEEEFETTKKRAEELHKLGLVEIVIETPKKKVKTKKAVKK